MIGSDSRMSEDVRDAVAKRWRDVEYSSLSGGSVNDDNKVKRPKSENLSRESSDNSTDVSSFNEVIVLDSEDEDDDENGKDIVFKDQITIDRILFDSHHCFKLIKSDSYDNIYYPARTDFHFITMKDIFREKNLKRSILFSYQFNMDFLLDCFDPNIEAITIVTQEECLLPLDPTNPAYYRLKKIEDKIKKIIIKMAPYTSHHTKMIINFYQDNTVRFFLPSNNFTKAEVDYPQQVCWCSPKLPFNEKFINKTPSLFKNGIISYLKSYERKDINDLILKYVDQIDCSTLDDVTFIFSSPGKNTQSGLGLLKQHIENIEDHIHTPSSKHRYLVQASSLGSKIGKDKHIFMDYIIPALVPKDCIYTRANDPDKYNKTYPWNNLIKEKIHANILYPTIDEVMESPNMYLSGGWFHFNYQANPGVYERLREANVFVKQCVSDISKERRTTPSHSKFYLKWSNSKDNDEKKIPDEIDWCLYTSANLSSVAWGRVTSNPRNFEIGVLLKQDNTHQKPLKCMSFVDLVYNRKDADVKNTVIVPFTKTYILYDHNDKPTNVAQLVPLSNLYKIANE